MDMFGATLVLHTAAGAIWSSLITAFLRSSTDVPGPLCSVGRFEAGCLEKLSAGCVCSPIRPGLLFDA